MVYLTISRKIMILKGGRLMNGDELYSLDWGRQGGICGGGRTSTLIKGGTF